jgi:tRNA threonylcarbamoyladenosine biosynthesis protein TsaB
MSLILAIETAVDICSVALIKGNEIIAFQESSEGKSHASLLTVFIDELLKKNKISVTDLSAVSVSKGPGSYTGLRIGVSAAKGLCYGAGIKLLGINTLQIMACSFLSQYKIDNTSNILLCPMIDARRQEVYTGFFDINGNERSDTRAVIISEDSFKDELDHNLVYFFGNGSGKCKDIIKHTNARFVDNISPLAKYMVGLSYSAFNSGHFEDIAYFEPFYLKDFVATTPKNKII